MDNTKRNGKPKLELTDLVFLKAEITLRKT